MIIPEDITTHNQLGAWGEKYVWSECRKAGYRVEAAHNGGDLVVNGKIVEVKTAAQGFDKKFRFCLCKQDAHGKTNHRRADIVILLAVSASGLVTTFVMPVETLTLKDNLVLPKMRGYRGKYAEYRKPIQKGLARWMH